MNIQSKGISGWAYICMLVASDITKALDGRNIDVSYMIQLPTLPSTPQVGQVPFSENQIGENQNDSDYAAALHLVKLKLVKTKSASDYAATVRLVKIHMVKFQNFKKPKCFRLCSRVAK